MVAPLMMGWGWGSLGGHCCVRHLGAEKRWQVCGSTMMFWHDDTSYISIHGWPRRERRTKAEKEKGRGRKGLAAGLAAFGASHSLGHKRWREFEKIA